MELKTNDFSLLIPPTQAKPNIKMRELKVPENLRKSYIVCSTGRSGSTLLCRTLGQLGYGNPQEYFHNKVRNELGFKENPSLDEFLRYWELILEKETSIDGVFGIKMHWWQLYNFLKVARQLPSFAEKSDYSILNAFFSNPDFVYIRRDDMVSQAVSTVIALQTKTWVVPSGKEKLNQQDLVQEKSDKIKFEPLKIYKWEQSFKYQNQAWVNFLTSEVEKEFYSIEHKQLIQNFDHEIKSIVQFLGLKDLPKGTVLKMPTKRQSSKCNKDFVRSYNRVPKFFWKLLYRIKKAF